MCIRDRAAIDPDAALAIWLAFVIVLVLIVDWLMGHYISRPIAKLNQAARRMAKLDFSAPCDISSPDEFGELSASLNTMAENLEQALSQLEAANEQLAEDMARKQRLLAERKELTDQLSHEMKTPLGVIRAYAEGLQDEPDETKQQRYAEVIIAETERMSSLITTLLDLSALETGASRLVPERFDLVEFVETVAGRLLLDVPDAHYDLRYELPEHQAYVYTDKARLEQVLDNLLVNAKKNVRPGGILQMCIRDSFYAGGKHFAYKPGAAIASCRRGGATATFEQLNKYFTINSMPIVSSQYWNMVHGNTPDEVRQDLEGLQTMRTLARNMAWLLRSLEAGRAAGITLPEAEPKIATNFIR